MKKPGVPLTKASELKSLEEFAMQLALMAQDLPDGVRNQAAGASRAAVSRSQLRMRTGLISSGTLNVVLFVALGLLALYYRGYDRGKQDAEVQVQQTIDEKADGPIVPALPPVVPPEDPALVKIREIALALSVLRVEHEKYLAAVHAASIARKKIPPKPQSLFDAEAALAKVQAKP